MLSRTMAKAAWSSFSAFSRRGRGVDGAGGLAADDVVDPLGHQDERLELAAGLEGVQGLEPQRGVEDVVDPGAQGGVDEVVAEALPLEDRAQAAGEELHQGGPDLGRGPLQPVAVGGHDLVHQPREGTG